MGKQAVCSWGGKQQAGWDRHVCLLRSCAAPARGKRYQSVVCIVYVYVCIPFLGHLRGFVEITKHNLPSSRICVEWRAQVPLVCLVPSWQ